MYQLFQRRELDGQRHLEEYLAFAKWNWWRNIVRSVNETLKQSSWASWISGWLPHVLSNEDFRHQPDTSLDLPTSGPEQLKSLQSPSRLPLNSTNFIAVLASALEELNLKCLLDHNLTLTSACVAKPQWVYNKLDQLILSAFNEAKIEVLSQQPRAEAAMKVATKIGKSEPLVLEQCGYSFNMQKRSSSMATNEWNAGWVPYHLTNEILEAFGPLPGETDEELNIAAGRLVREIAKARNILKFSYGEKPNDIEEQETVIIVPDFGVKGLTFARSLPGKNISRVEEDFTLSIRDAVENMLLNHGEVSEYRSANNLFEDIPKHDYSALRAAALDFAKTVPHPQVHEGKSWWDSIDAILVLADFPDANLIRRGACRAVTEIPGLECTDMFDASFSHYGMAARGGALEAHEFIEYWEMEQNWKRCEEDETLPGCRYEDVEDGYGRDGDGHEEL
jgi:hypothetical protein